LVDWIGGLLERMPATQFWLLHAGLAGIAGIIFPIGGRLFGHLLAPGEDENRAQKQALISAADKALMDQAVRGGRAVG
jgi:hypothetical protein